MALNITKTNAYDVGQKMVSLTKVSPDLLADLHNANYGVKVSDDTFQFWWRGDETGPETLLDSVKFNDFTQLKEGKLSAGVLHALSTLLTNKISSILGNQNSALAMLPKKKLLKVNLKPKSESSVYDGDEDEEQGLDEGGLTHADGPKSKASPTLDGMWPIYGGSITSGERVKLKQATELYQPVYATSGGSRYFLIAGCKDIKLACRFSDGGNISLRVEGDNLGKYSNPLKMCGFNDQGKYQSVHLHPTKEDPTLPRKTVGAILFALGAPWKTMVPDLDFINNKGS